MGVVRVARYASIWAPGRRDFPASRSSDTGVWVIGLLSLAEQKDAARGTDATPPHEARQEPRCHAHAACRHSASRDQVFEKKALFVGDNDLDAAVARASRSGVVACDRRRFAQPVRLQPAARNATRGERVAYRVGAAL